jgi:SnoaL-like domain
MRRGHLSVALLVASLCATPLAGQVSPVDTAALLKPVNRLLTAFNAHVDTVPHGIFTDDAVVVDVISPFVWAGAGAVGRWYADLLGRTAASPRANDLIALDQHLEIGSPESVQVAGDHAMFVVRAVATYLDHGTRQRQVARWVLTERRLEGEWRIAAHVFDVTG